MLNLSKLKFEVKSVIAAMLITVFLFFLDEGYYNFNWVLKLGNWYPFIVYSLSIYVGQLLFYFVFLKNYKRKYKATISYILGGSLGFIVVAYLIFTKW